MSLRSPPISAAALSLSACRNDLRLISAATSSPMLTLPSSFSLACSSVCSSSHHLPHNPPPLHLSHSAAALPTFRSQNE
eukprot:CAMPEP_0181182072 /NCGR_PEP_ID=MMETSP1096-20121128/7685_1 /TAXON_ID=156174 ORGANISM="Chrysochromulina ericina, Strain CCMP281" /NCGR_SAMPLE_ID=MMETSP1096 /ASSEMBLY_ACC=CAM_ASM_000453 /LENGTH=78 /DNA_ID=CAMNT_0023270637 /DNA_START=302 /DNA_END=538 /DNA_ORIENTATION=+